jgi:HSP20 family protein
MLGRRRRDIFSLIDMLSDPFEVDNLFGVPAERREDPVRVNVEHDADNYYVRAVVPGFADDELHVAIDGRVLTVSGKRERVSDDSEFRRDGTDAPLLSSSRASFTQKVQMLPDARLDDIEAEHKDGILVVTVPRKAVPKIESRSIPIKASKQLEASS